MINLFNYLNWKTILEIVILWVVIYQIFLFLKGTKAAYLLRGIIVLVASLLLFQALGLPVLSRMLTPYSFAVFVILIIIIFQPELREGLVRLGKRHFFSAKPSREEMEKIIREIVLTVDVLAKKNIGALIAIKRELGLKDYIESGIIVNAELSSQLLQSIFYPLTPLHDGGVIVDGTTIVAASCLFPHSDNPDLEKTLGTRHRSGVGLSEHSDAVVLIVSEENGSISLAINGQLTSNLTAEDLSTILKGQLSSK
jgi:diadenylate cyclase